MEDKNIFSYDDELDFSVFDESVEKNENLPIKTNFFESKKNEFSIKKPDLKIYADENEDFIKVKLGFDEDLRSQFKEVFKSAKFNNEDKKYYVNQNKLNIQKLDLFLRNCSEVFGDVTKVFDFDVNIIKRKEEIKVISISDMFSKSEKREVKSEFVGKEENKNKEKHAGGSRKSIHSQKKTMSETIEETVYNLIKDRILVSSVDHNSVYIFNDKKGSYSKDESIGLSPYLIKIMNRNSLNSYTNDSDLKSIEKSLLNYALADGKVSNFSNKFVSVSLSDNPYLENAVLYISYKKDGTRAFRVINSHQRIKSNVYCNVNIDVSLIKDLNGNVWSGEDLDNNEYFYEFKTNKKSDLYKLFLDTLFESKNHLKLAQMYFGGIFTDRQVFKAIFLCGEGNDGKSVLFKMISDLFTDITVFFKFNKENDFQYQRLKGKKIGLVSEVKEFKFDEMMFKNLTGGDETYVNGKHIKEFKVDSENMYLAIAMNYEDTFRLKNVDDAMRRRFAFCKCITSPRIIAGFDRKIMDGFFFEEEKREVDSQRLELVHWLLEGALENLNTNAFLDKSIEAEKYGQDVADFYESMMSKMAPKGEFFKDYKFEVLTNYKVTTIADLYDYYLKWCDSEKVTNVMGSTIFKKEIIKFSNKEFDINLTMTDFRGKVDNSLKRCLPINIVGSNIKQYDIQTAKHLVDSKIISSEKYLQDNNYDIVVEKPEDMPF